MDVPLEEYAQVIELPGDNTQFVGGMGELIFQHWCRSIGANPIKVDFDELGIDFSVTFPSVNGRVVALDLLEPEFVCRIQVKSTDSPKDSASIKFGKWLPLINDLCPAFVLLINYDRKKVKEQWLSRNFNYDDLPVSAFLMPIDEERMTDVLRELRAADTADILRERSKSIKARPGEEIYPNGYALREAIRNHVGDYSEYVPRKRLLRKNVGYSAERRVHKLEFQWTDEMQGDFVLGLPAPATLVKVENIRFGIPREEPIDDPAVQIKGPNRVPPVPGVTVSFSSGALSASFQTTLYHPLTVLPHLRKYKILLTSGPLTLTLSSTVLRINCSLDTHASLEFWLNAFRLIHLSAAGPMSMLMQHGSASEESTITIPSESMSEELLDLKVYKSIECALEIARFFGRDVGDVRPASLADAFEPIGILYSLVINAGEGTFEIELSEDELKGCRGKHIAIILRPGVTIGSWHFSAAVVIHGRIAKRIPSGGVTVLSSCEVVAKFARPGGEGLKPPIKPLDDAALAWCRKRRMQVIELDKLRLQSRL